MELSLQLLISLVAAAFGAVLPLVREAIRAIFGRSPELAKSGPGRVLTALFQIRVDDGHSGSGRLLSDLQKTSAEMDRIIADIGHFIGERQRSVIKLENDLAKLANRERELKENIEQLEKIPVAVADRFAALVEKGEKRSALRDYFLFLGGVLASAVVAVVLKKLGY